MHARAWVKSHRYNRKRVLTTTRAVLTMTFDYACHFIHSDCLPNRLSVVSETKENPWNPVTEKQRIHHLNSNCKNKNTRIHQTLAVYKRKAISYTG